MEGYQINIFEHWIKLFLGLDSFQRFWIKNTGLGSDRIDSFWKKKLIREVNQNFFLFFFHVGESFDFWFTVHLDFYSFCFPIQFDFIHFDPVWLWVVGNNDSPANHDSPANQKSKVGESWFSHFRIMGWYDFELEAN